MGLCLFCLLYLLVGSALGGETDGGVLKTTYHVDTVKIGLKPPGNITVFRVTDSSIFLTWDAPAVYPIHDVNATNYDNSTGDVTTTTSSPTGSHTTTTSKMLISTETSRTINTTSSEKGNNSANATSVSKECMPLGFFEKVDHNSSNVTNSTVETGIYVNFVNSSTLPLNITQAQDDNIVPFDQGCVQKYIVHYIDTEKGTNLTMDVQPSVDDDITEANITGLSVNSTYTIYVAAEYISGHILNSNSVNVTTKKNVCVCDAHGTLRKKGQAGQILCNHGMDSLMCLCKPGYTGKFCELCSPGSYRTDTTLPCHRCPCSPQETYRQTCHFREGFLICDACRHQYTGNMCQSCANGYYRYHRDCVPCQCHGNSDPKAPSMCDPYQGNCQLCIHNTTGFHCERCLFGYVGDAIYKKNCILESDAGVGGLSKGVIAGICIAVILILSGIVGFAVYRRWKIFPPKKPFWTVELKEDRDSVNFSAVPEHDYQNIDSAGVDDLEFYESHGGKGSGKSVSRYSPLKEDI